MKIIFVLDDQTVIAATPEELQLRQIQPDLAALMLPAGQNENGEDLFQPLITYPVVLSVPPPKVEAVAEPVAPAAPQPTLVKAKKKKA